MKGLVLANIDYEPIAGRGGHTSDEGMQLQRGLEHAGWTLAGAGFGDGCRHVPTLIARHRPDVVFVQDVRDWDPSCECCFRKDVGFEEVEYLSRCRNVFKVGLLKDAGTYSNAYRKHADEIGANALVTYYEPQVVTRLCPWSSSAKLVRTYHSIDRDAVLAAGWPEKRRLGLVSGANAPKIYPVRAAAIRHCHWLGIDYLKHPGYSNDGSSSSGYLQALARYKCHVATASKFGFALRKIIESACVGCVPVTNLQYSDRLPVIDAVLERVPDDSDMAAVRDAIRKVDREWDASQQSLKSTASAAIDFYDWRAIGKRLSLLVESLAGTTQLAMQPDRRAAAPRAREHKVDRGLRAAKGKR